MFVAAQARDLDRDATSIGKIGDEVGQAYLEGNAAGQRKSSLKLLWGRRAIPGEFDQITVNAGELIALLRDRASAA